MSERPLRIAYLTGRYPAVSHTFVLREVEALRAMGLEVDSFSVWRTDPSELLSPADRAEHERTFALLPPVKRAYLAAHSAALRRGPLAYLAHLAGALALAPAGARGKLLALSWFAESLVVWQRCRARGIHHVHAHLNGTAPAVAMLAARFANRLGGVPESTWSMTVHGPAEFYEVRAERLAEKVREAAFVVCTSYYARSQIMSQVDESEWDKLVVVRCGVPAGWAGERNGEAAGSGAAAPVAGDRGASILSVARLAAQKGQGVLVDAVAELRRRDVAVKLTLVGGGPKRAALERRIAARAIDGSFELVGPLGSAQVAAYYRQADVFCLSSLAEGVPVVLMEAMTAGVPVVAPRTMGIPELIEDGVSGLLVTPGRADELADALQRLLADRELRQRLSREGRRKVREEFSLERAASQLYELFRDRAGGS